LIAIKTKMETKTKRKKKTKRTTQKNITMRVIESSYIVHLII
jgi:hypothetical protein